MNFYSCSYPSPIFIDSEVMLRCSSLLGIKIDFVKFKQLFNPDSFIDFYAYVSKTVPSPIKRQLDFLCYNGYGVHELNDETSTLTKMSVDMVVRSITSRPPSVIVVADDVSFLPAFSAIANNGVPINLIGSLDCPKALIKSSKTFTQINDLLMQSKLVRDPSVFDLEKENVDD